jgi:hypothetical protein
MSCLRPMRRIEGTWDRKKEKGQVETRPGLLGESAHNKQPAAVIIFWLSEVAAALPSFAHKPRVPKRWPLRPRS